GRLRLDHDWYAGGIPANVSLGRDVYIDTSYGFAPFFSEQSPGLTLGDATGAYDRATFMIGKEGRVTVGAYTVLNGTYLVCHERINIGSHCLIAWGSVITDTWLAPDSSIDERRDVLHRAAADSLRRLAAFARPRPVTLEDNVWVGFDSVVLPGVMLGRGAVVGCKTVIAENVPAYAVVVGDPARIIRYLNADDTEAERERALREYAR
ncbi:MAG: acyltransferase, partial [Acidobacteriota bacterium]|nr:acyltransferase [Acidobacteriota bacterium]